MAFSPIAFFARWASVSWNPATQTREEGRVEGARKLARAEALARDLGFSFECSIDPDVTSADWRGPRQDGGKYRNPWATWFCVMRDPAGEVAGSLGGIDFGRDGEPWGKAYRRVIEAELACEIDADSWADFEGA
jgi:hypothetical protein